ncbi:Eukaryotic aspartyl protease [Aphelenchoides besseyi]|nr:Eukaryotic aspartyl protease [Aphelenchoides besseyi]
MSTMLIGSLLIAANLLTFVDAGSWKLPIQEVKRVQRKNSLGLLNDVYPGPLHLDRNHYRATIYLGTSSMPFRVMIDTGSHVLWVPKIGCKASGEFATGNCESSERVYDPKKSTKAENHYARFYAEYGGGNDWVKGHYYKDVFSFGENMRIKYPIMFGVGEQMKNEDQGILGLGNAIDPGERGSSILHEAWRHRIIDAPVFTIYLQKCPESEDCENHGMITIGSYDKEMCGEVVGHVDVNPNSIHWLFELSSFKLGRALLSKPFKAMIDLGAPGIYISTYAYKLTMSMIKATRMDGLYVVKCDADVDVTLQINGQKYTVPGSQLLVNLHNGFCSLRLYPYDRPDDVWLIGTPFSMVYCITHNFEAHTVEFAPA